MKLSDIELPSTIPPSVREARETLLAAGAEEVFDTHEMLTKFKISDRTCDRIVAHYPDLSAKYDGKRWFGSLDAIAEFRRTHGAK